MDYNTLIAAKGTAGSLQSWVNYAKLDSVTVVDEAQPLLFTLLRTREMRSQYRFSMPVNSSAIALPPRFLDPIGRMKALSLNMEYRHKDQAFIEGVRIYSEFNGTLDTDPFTTTNGSASVNVLLQNHQFTQESSFYTTGAVAFNGVTIAGTFNITQIVDANNFTIDISPLGTLPNAGGTGGGSAATYLCDVISIGSPLYWAIWDEIIHFDQAFDQQVLINLAYYKAPPLLSSTNNTNWLTNRYPQLLRQACLTQAADFMKHDSDYQRHLTLLTAMVERVNIENDMELRGAEIEVETP